jgi:thiol peroxidase
MKSPLARFAVVLFLSSTFAAVHAPAAETVRRTGLVTGGGGKPLALLGHPIAVGEKAPDFTAFDAHMQPVRLADYAGKVVVITSFPSVDTKVCAAQTRAFNQRASEIPNVQVLTVSADLPFALDRFCAAEGIERVRTLSDYRTMDYALKYGFLLEELRLLARGTVIVDAGGVVRYVEIVPQLGQEPDYGRAVDVARSLAAATR